MTARYLSNLAAALTPEGVIPAAKGGTGTTTGAGSSPTITSITYIGNDTATNTAGGSTVTINGTNFGVGASVIVNGITASVVTRVNSTQITFTTAAQAAGSYILYVVNTDGSTALAVPGIQYSGVPIWSTAAGGLGTAYETGAISTTLTATGDAPITYTLASGTLPTGSTLASNGTLSGTAQATTSATTYTFAVTARDAQNQTTNRSFSLTINPDVVTWSTPTASATYNVDKDTVMANVIMSATSAAGGSIAYTADTLPTGLSITGANIAGTPTVAASITTTLTATATSTRAATRTINWVVSVADPYFMYNSLLLPGTGTNGTQNNTFLDSSTNNFTITRAGNTTQGTFSPYGPNWSNYFDGSSYLQSADPGIGSGSFTTEFWVNFNTLPTGYTIFVVGTTSNTQFFITTKVNGTGLRFGLSGVAEYATGTFTWSAGTWYHVALVRNSTAIKFYINGTNVTDGSPTNATSYSGELRIAGGAAGVINLTGYISNLRTVKSAVYTANFTPSTSPLTAIANTALLTCQSNRFIDNSSSALAITTSGSPTVQRFSPFSPTAAYSTSTTGGSGYFDGAGDHLLIPTATPLVLSGSVWTMECWVYPTFALSTSQYQVVICKRNHASAASYDLYFNLNSGHLSYFNGTGYNSSALPTINAWNHIAAVYDGTNINLYMNGVRVLQTATTNTDNGGNLSIGADENGTSNFFTGYISNVRILKGTALYSGTTYTVPTEPLTAVANTTLLLSATNAGIIDNTMQNNLETVGNAQISTTQSKFGESSMSFDGNGDYCFLPRTSSFLFSSVDFTIELWTYISDTTTRKYILGPGTDTASHYKGFGLEIWGQQLSMWAGSTGSSWNMLQCDTSSNRGSTLMAANTWYHIAVTRNGNTFRSFVNGVVEKTFTVSGTIYSDPTVPYNIGRSGYSPGNYFYFNGYMDDLRITLGYARYTANFTPATSALPYK